MKVFKFGGASVKDSAGVRNLTEIISYERADLVVVVSAFGKTTNALEKVLFAWQSGENGYKGLLEEVFNYHRKAAAKLFTKSNTLHGRLENSFALLKDYLALAKKSGYDFDYDQVVSYGEIWSTMIVEAYLENSGIEAEWIDIRDNLFTDDTYRDANVLWSESSSRIKRTFDFTKKRVYVTQGFIGGTVSGLSTTLGREGSDYTAAIIANILDAELVVVWKDVPGLLNADPRWLPDTIKLTEISYKEAVEMTFSGAKIIHPKTIKPLHNKNIPLFVKSFLDPGDPGTVIKADAKPDRIIPIFIRKEKQILISILPKDFSFVMGDNLSMIFHLFITHGIKVNLVQASAISINVSVDDERGKVENLIEDLKKEYKAVYNEKVEMISIRHYTPEALERISAGREILIEQRTRRTVRYIMRTEENIP